MGIDFEYESFVWDADKSLSNLIKHKIDFVEATRAFLDPKRIVVTDEGHSSKEPRYFCLGKIGKKVATVRFTYRQDKIRIIGAGYWRKEKSYYEKENKIKN